MKKFLAIAIILTLFGITACKKKEEEKPSGSTQPSAQQPAKPGEFKPREKKKKNGKDAKVATALEIYQDNNLVTTVPQSQYPTITTTKIKMGGKQVDAISLKDLLAKNNIKTGKSVVLSGEVMNANLTWEQANSNDLYVYMTPKKFLKIQPNKELAKVKFPKRLDKITVSASDVAVAKPANSKPSNQ